MSTQDLYTTINILQVQATHVVKHTHVHMTNKFDTNIINVHATNLLLKKCQMYIVTNVVERIHDNATNVVKGTDK